MGLPLASSTEEEKAFAEAQKQADVDNFWLSLSTRLVGYAAHKKES